mmetsp:Transcript_58331/g.190233  ORF Transcript_58331/g.190233 Transcript_58331/m.190233 type:complete len:212 (-) Transcript_58331:64-699(-)
MGHGPVKTLRAHPVHLGEHNHHRQFSLLEHLPQLLIRLLDAHLCVDQRDHALQLVGPCQVLIHERDPALPDAPGGLREAVAREVNKGDAAAHLEAEEMPCAPGTLRDRRTQGLVQLLAFALVAPLRICRIRVPVDQLIQKRGLPDVAPAREREMWTWRTHFVKRLGDQHGVALDALLEQLFSIVQLRLAQPKAAPARVSTRVSWPPPARVL